MDNFWTAVAPLVTFNLSCRSIKLPAQLEKKIPVVVVQKPKTDAGTSVDGKTMTRKRYIANAELRSPHALFDKMFSGSQQVPEEGCGRHTMRNVTRKV
jgi:NAD kinase